MKNKLNIDVVDKLKARGEIDKLKSELSSYHKELNKIRKKEKEECERKVDLAYRKFKYYEKVER